MTDYELLSFLDAYSEYNQIRMSLSNDNKTTLMIKGGNFCYKVMTFELKNVEATYHRLMNKVFKVSISNVLEVYVDDIVVKSNRVEDCPFHLEKVFSKVKQHNLNLNMEKCVFSVGGGISLSL